MIQIIVQSIAHNFIRLKKKNEKKDQNHREKSDERRMNRNNGEFILRIGYFNELVFGTEFK